MRRVAALITTNINVDAAAEVVHSARVFVCQLLKTAPFNTTFKHNLARTLVAAARGTHIFRWISGEEGVVSNLKTLPPDAQFFHNHSDIMKLHVHRGARIRPRPQHTQLKCRCGRRNYAFCKTTFKERVHRVAAQITTNTNVAVAVGIVRSARVAFCQLPKTAFPANNF